MYDTIVYFCTYGRCVQSIHECVFLYFQIVFYCNVTNTHFVLLKTIFGEEKQCIERERERERETSYITCT